ncbi:nicotinate phosphoribosyltransferase family-domain-containing protein [Piptocephalis cylindrospora]|uniref:Nicotinamide phosphoribosyltransferase n=1 Tax=Piptocephalis cylindrospora TaxID=1907219 RepID=A0A4P9Y4R0_9FUNG|nr:nicotinate phosphoribosyltransferase family-domain-containing protein [Piptocephalis cylindrospora]|eukprot:RKP13141.1 nicotinate phosphoribosyltransferase family-domain-containing protein [Piptocephalis cylindrospora]
MDSFLGLPFLALTDSYKISHPEVYPKARKMVAYGEFRKAFQGDEEDHRIVFYGLRYIVDRYLRHQWTQEEVERAADFFSTHGAGGKPFPFPRDLFDHIVQEHNGTFPVRIEALREGSVCYPHVPVYQIIAEGEFARLVTFLETLLTMVWYPSTVATLSRRTRTLIEEKYALSVDPEAYGSLGSRLNDFGFRGCSCVEQAVLGGCAHLLNFEGTDTLAAAYYAQYHLNEGRPVGMSIPATEHSVMTAFRTERDAILRMIDLYGEGAFACVMDSYDYVKALKQVLPTVMDAKWEKGGFMVLRPDSGDPTQAVILALKAADEVAGSKVNGKGYKVLRGMGVIQGDGVDYAKCQGILDAVLAAGYSAENVAFGMGGGLLQKVNRDTMSFATKLSHITYGNGERRDVMKTPKTDKGKFSLPGELVVQVNDQIKGGLTVRPKEEVGPEEKTEWEVVYDHGKVCEWENFDQVRQRLNEQWSIRPRTCDVISPGLHAKVARVIQEMKERGTTDAEE